MHPLHTPRYAAPMTWIFLALHILLVLSFGMRILLRDDLLPDVRMGWLAVIVLLPYVSCVLYYLFGEVALGRRGGRKRLNVHDYAAAQGPEHGLPAGFSSGPAAHSDVQDLAPQWRAAFDYAASINRFAPQAGHQAELMANGAAARAQLLADMDAAQHSIHVLYYIWLNDDTGTAVAHALMRAAQRGLTCRAMVDGLGSRALLHSPLWRDMAQAGVQLAVALPIHNLLKVIVTSRVDLRNHRKITVIDGRIAHCGSQNCADESFAVKAKFAPWVDIMLRLEGPVATQMQWIFASDWAQSSGSPLTPPEQDIAPHANPSEGFVALAIAEGPSERRRSTPQLVATVLCSAHHDVTISTPYFIPDATVLEALCATALRGVKVSLILPARNDSWVVGAASRSTYRRLLKAGVHIHEFRPGLLHAKTLCVDDALTLMGSTNLDLRSFDLNFENNVLLHDRALTARIRERQADYMRQSNRITTEQVAAWPWWRRGWNNLLATISPVL